MKARKWVIMWFTSTMNAVPWSRIELFFAHRLNSISIVRNFNSLHTNTPAETL
jgi:hypothetical protein